MLQGVTQLKYPVLNINLKLTSTVKNKKQFTYFSSDSSILVNFLVLCIFVNFLVLSILVI